MNFPLFIARRYLFSKKSKNVINIISTISVAGVTIGTMALVIVLSVFNGFDHLIKSMFSTFDPDIKIQTTKGKTFILDSTKIAQIKSIGKVLYYSEIIEDQALLEYGKKHHIGIVKGVSRDYTKICGIDSTIIDGNFYLKNKNNSYAVIGQGVAYFLHVGLKFITPLKIYVPKRGKKVSIDPRNSFNKKFIFPVGIFVTHQEEFDSKYVIVPIDYARKLFDYKTEISAIELKLSHLANEKDIKNKLKNILGKDFSIKNRYEQHATMYRIMQSEKWVIFLILAFILFIASFNVIGSLTMLIIEKKNDINTLQNVGASKSLIRRIFLIEGWFISFGGAFLGILLGVTICFLQQKFGFISFPSSNFIISHYPVDVQFLDLILIFITVLIIGFLAAWYPVRYLTRIHLELK